MTKPIDRQKGCAETFFFSTGVVFSFNAWLREARIALEIQFEFVISMPEYLLIQSKLSTLVEISIVFEHHDECPLRLKLVTGGKMTWKAESRKTLEFLLRKSSAPFFWSNIMPHFLRSRTLHLDAVSDSSPWNSANWTRWIDWMRGLSKIKTLFDGRYIRSQLQ